MTAREQVTKIIGETSNGASRTLHVRRADEDLALVVTPAKPKARTMPLFERLPDKDWSVTETMKGNGGAAALLVASGRAVEEHGLTPLARVHTMVVEGSDPVLMLTGPIPATEKLLARSGVPLADIGSFEVNEAFASIPMAWLAETGADPERTNPQGGAIALGHPLGATGAMLIGTVLDELERRNKTTGLVTMCIGGGMGVTTIIERI